MKQENEFKDIINPLTRNGYRALRDNTVKAIEAPLKFTHSLMEQSEKLRTPSPKVDKIGRIIGVCMGVGLLFTGSVWLLIGNLSWGIGSLFAGMITVISNLIYYHRNKN